MVRGIDLISKDRNLQENWAKRLIAVIIDGIIVLAFCSILFVFSFGVFFFWNIWQYWLNLLFGFSCVLYFTLLERVKGVTIGKHLMHLRVISPGGMSFQKALIRNLSKAHWLFLFIDGVLGFVIEGNPKQRFLDRIADTVVG